VNQTAAFRFPILLLAAIFLLAGCAAGPPAKPAPAAGSPAALNEAGNRYLKGDLAGGIRHFTELEGKSPGNPLAVWWIGRLKYQQGDSGAAALDFTRAAALRPGEAVLGRWAGAAWMQAGEPGKAAEALRQVVPPRTATSDFRLFSPSGVPTSPQDTLSGLLGQLVAACEQAGRHDEAVDALRRLYELNPGGADYSRLSRLYSSAKRYDEAMEAAKLALQANAASPAANLAMGAAYEGKGRIAEAVGYYRKAIPAAAASAAAVAAPAGRGGVTAAGRGGGSGRFDASGADPRSQRMAMIAEAAARQIGAVPQDASAAPPPEEGAVRLASLFLDLRDFETAEKVLRIEERKRPGRAGLEMGWALYFQGKTSEALEFAEKELKRHASVRVGMHLEADPAGAGIRVASVGKNAPAEAAGILAGDVITAADGESMKGKHFSYLANKVRTGAPGTPVGLSLARAGVKGPLPKSVVRELVYAKEAAPGFAFRSLLHRAAGRTQEAARDAERAAELAPGTFWGLYAKGLEPLDAAALERAVAAAPAKGAGAAPPEPFVDHARLAQAGALARKGRLDDAEALLRSLPDADRTEKDVPLSRDRETLLETMRPVREVLLSAAANAEGAGKAAEALPALSRALPLAGSPAEAKAIRGRLVKAAASAGTLPEVPEGARRHGLRGQLLVKEGRLADALPEFRLASREAPYDPLFHMNRALLCGELGRYEEAIHAMETYLALSPAAPNARQGKDTVIQWELQLERQREGL